MPRHGKWSATIVGIVTTACLMALTISSATAQETRARFSDTIHVVQQKPVLQKGRLDLVPRFGISLNDSIQRSFKAGVNANYHFTERVYGGAIFEWYNFGNLLGGPTSVFDDARTETRSTSDAAVINWATGAEIGFVPLVGKFALFNRGIFYYDIALTAGGMWVDSASIALPTAQGGAGGTISLSNRIFLNSWMAINIEVRDVIFSARLRGVEDGAISHVVTASLGLSLYLPTSFEYSEDQD